MTALIGLSLGAFGVGTSWLIVESRRTPCDMTNFRFLLLLDNRTSVLNQHAMIIHRGILHKTLKQDLTPEEAACANDLPMHPFAKGLHRVLQVGHLDDIIANEVAEEAIDSYLTPITKTTYM